MIGIKIRKLAYCLMHPQCWQALRLGVAPSIEHRKVLAVIDCDLILDVGGNRGQFSLISRMVKPGLPIVAFEPIPTEAEIFRKALSGKNVQLHSVALGENAGEVEIHLSRSADSSSLLPIGELQRKLFRDTDEVGTLKVPVKRLDDFKSEWENYSRILLKIDVQGFELSVLKGAVEALKNCAYVYVECSETELYLGQAMYSEITDFLRQNGFELHSQCNETKLNGKLVHADCLFTRP